MFSRWRDRARHTLGFRLALWYALFFTVSSGLVTGLTYLLLSRSLEQRDREIVRARLVAYADEYDRGGLQALDRMFRRERAAGIDEPLFVRVVAGGQEAVILNLPPAWNPGDLRRLAVPDTRGAPLWSSLLGQHANQVLEVASVRLGDGSLVQVGKSTEGRALLLRNARRVMSLVLAAIVIIGVAGGSLLTRSTLIPLRELTATVESIVQTGRVEARVPVRRTSDPLDRLGGLVNVMLERISTLIDGMRGSLDQIAHDLRTPMARLRARLETALASTDDPGQQREMLADCLEDVDRVRTMLDTLMDIAEAESGTMRLHREPTVLADIVADAVELYVDVADERRIAVATSVPQDLLVTVDGTRIRQAVANLLDNALKYTPPGGRVTIEARRAGSGARLSVSDTGSGIPSDDLPRIWERLYRGDRSRTERGLGLGLSLVRAVVEAHGGRVEAISEPGRGSTFVLHLPA